jgi:hypothetical protein
MNSDPRVLCRDDRRTPGTAIAKQRNPVSPRQSTEQIPSPNPFPGIERIGNLFIENKDMKSSVIWHSPACLRIQR